VSGKVDLGCSSGGNMNTVSEPAVQARTIRPLSDLYGKTVYTMTNGGMCRPTKVSIDGAISEAPYRIEDCVICDMPGPHPHFVEQLAVECRRHQESLGAK
jgi:hypothetical protein